MNIALCYQNVLPARGGCETYLVDLTRRLTADGHDVHLYASRWDQAALPSLLHIHPVTMPECMRFRRPWLFGQACLRVLSRSPGHDVTLGFDKTWGQDVLYPQGGLHRASIDHNLRSYPRSAGRSVAQLRTWFDPAYWSFARLERCQYLAPKRGLVIVNSAMVASHFEDYYGIDPRSLRVIPNAIDPKRFQADDRGRLRLQLRERWGFGADEVVGLFAAMNYRLKGLEPLLHAVRLLPRSAPFRLVVAGNPRKRGYEALARRLGIAERVRFIGYCADMKRCYFAADFLVHPTFYDPCSLVVLEALACGLPVITSAYNGASELLQNQDEGFVIDDPHDHRQLARRMEQMLDTELRRRCSEAARTAAARWTFDDHYQALLRVCHEAAVRKQAA